MTKKNLPVFEEPTQKTQLLFIPQVRETLIFVPEKNNFSLHVFVTHMNPSFKK